jgi:hypothetical protein
MKNKPVAVDPRLADATFEPSARQLDAIARAAVKTAVARRTKAMAAFHAAIRVQVAESKATLAHPPSAPTRRECGGA